jgi:hypothetical protein
VVNPLLAERNVVGSRQVIRDGDRISLLPDLLSAAKINKP